MKVYGYHQLFVTNILQNIFFCVQQKKETQVLNNIRVSINDIILIFDELHLRLS